MESRRARRHRDEEQARHDDRQRHARNAVSVDSEDHSNRQTRRWRTPGESARREMRARQYSTAIGHRASTAAVRSPTRPTRPNCADARVAVAAWRNFCTIRAVGDMPAGASYARRARCFWWRRGHHRRHIRPVGDPLRRVGRERGHARCLGQRRSRAHPHGVHLAGHRVSRPDPSHVELDVADFVLARGFTHGRCRVPSAARSRAPRAMNAGGRSSMCRPTLALHRSVWTWVAAIAAALRPRYASA